MKLRVFHIDFNSVALKPAAILRALERAAASGCNAILWEVEDKIRWETCPEAVHSDAFSKEDFRAVLVRAGELGLEPIPLLQTFGHAEYVLMQPSLAHLRELPGEYDCYCSSNPEVRAFLRRWIAEYRDLFGPVRFFHLGGDEAYHFGQCPHCAARNRLELYAEHLLAVSEDLRRDGVKVCIWDDFSRKSMWWNEAAGDAVSPDISPLRPFVLWNWVYTPESDFSHAAELAAEGFETVVAGSVSSYGDDPFLPDWTQHLPNIAAMRQAAEPPDIAGWCITSWSIRYGLKRLQLPMLAADPEAALAAALPGLAPNVALRALRLAGAFDKRLAVFLAQHWTRYKDSRLPPSGWLAERIADPALAANVQALRIRIPELLSGLDEAEAVLGRGETSGRAVGGAGAESPSFAALLLAAIALKRAFLEALGAAVGFAGCPAPSPDALAALRDRTAAFYGLEMTPATAACAAAIVWNPLLDLLGTPPPTP